MKPVLSGTLSTYSNGPELDRLHLRHPEQQQDGPLQPLVDHDPAADHLGHAGLAVVEQVDGLAHELAGVLVVGLELGPALPQLVDLGLEVSHGRRRYKRLVSPRGGPQRVVGRWRGGAAPGAGGGPGHGPAGRGRRRRAWPPVAASPVGGGVQPTGAPGRRAAGAGGTAAGIGGRGHAVAAARRRPPAARRCSRLRPAPLHRRAR